MVKIVAAIIEEVVVLKVIEEELKITNNRIIPQISLTIFYLNLNLKYNLPNKPYSSLKYNSLNYRNQTNNSRNLLPQKP